MVWTLEQYKSEGLRFKNRTEFSFQSRSAYNAAYKNKWLDEVCEHMRKKKEQNGHWTKERCLQEAKKHNTRTEFSEKSSSAYTVAKRNSWLDSCCEHMIVLGSKVKRAIYVFEFSDNHSYIGLTYNLDARKKQHLKATKSPVYKHLHKTSTSFKFIILSEYVELEEAVKLEGSFIEKYENSNWKLLNSRSAGATGGSTLIWTFDRCFEEALEYKTRKDFKNNSASAHGSALRNKWLDDICSHMDSLQNKKNHWNFDNCKAEALKYKTKTEFNKKAGSAYSAAKRHGWFDKVCLHMIEPERWSIWNKESCHSEALKYKSKKEFRDNASGAYSAAQKKGFIKEVCVHMKSKIKPKGFWTKDNCAHEALKFDTRSKFQKSATRAYALSHKNGWLDEICSHMIQFKEPSGHWTKKTCSDEANKYNTRSEFNKKSGGAAAYARKNGFFDDICLHMQTRNGKPNGYWTKERCLNEAKKYNTKAEFRKMCPNVFARIYRKSWKEEAFCHMKVINRPTGYWTKEKCLNEAAKYSTRSEFNKKSGGAAAYARGWGWYDEIWEDTHPSE